MAHLLFTLENGRLGAREVMINQHAGEPRRKLLELAAHSIVVFFSEGLEVAAVEVEAKGHDRILRWRRDTGRVEFRVRNLGKGYANYDEMKLERGFDFDLLRRDIAASRPNLQPAILDVLEFVARDRDTRPGL